jgi:8-oxo-dGTP diphosphatase
MSSHGVFQITQKVFLRDGEKLLVMRDKKSGCGDLPGGRMNEDEFFQNWKTSIERELFEELGPEVKYELEDKPFLVHPHRVILDDHPCIILGYRAKYLSGNIIMSDEHDYMNWVNPKDFDMSSLFSEYMLEALNIYKKEYA